mmetsp:Transcript_99352/g.280371  ORF Transcript_99352/g.280371 Transcript_99352/m.280371 type:complete len:241 (+) Transcript_99352:191-913(+)
MLHLTKNKIVTGVAKSQVEVRQMELDWYCGNYSAMMGQSAMLAGFAFGQLTTGMPVEHPPPFWLEFAYLFITCVVIGLELGAIVLSTALAVWGPSLALRGKMGTQDVHKAVDCLHDYQGLIFLYFMIGWVLDFFTSILQVWIYFRRRVAIVVTIPMSCFIVAIVWFTVTITAKLRVADEDAVKGKIDALQPYEYIGDLDHGLQTNAGHLGAKRATYCPVHTTYNIEMQAQTGGLFMTGPI